MSIKKEIARLYLKFLQEGDLKSIQKLFTEDAEVHSPVYGTMNAQRFYEVLLEDTATSVVELKGVFEEAETNRFALYFSYKWTLRNQKEVAFDVMDIIELNDSDLITDLRIIYDTVQSRVLVRELKD